MDPQDYCIVEFTMLVDIRRGMNPGMDLESLVLWKLFFDPHILTRRQKSALFGPDEL